MEILDLVNFMVSCDDLGPIIRFIKAIFTIIQIVIPIGLIIMGSIDLAKAVFSSDDKAIKTATGSLVKRAIAAVAVFFIVFIVNLLMEMVSDANEGDEDGTVISCWSQV